jgi:uncharacterized membrane protein
MNWVVFIIGMTVALCLMFFGLHPSVVIAFGFGMVCGIFSAKAKLAQPFPMDPVQIKLRRMASRLRYLSQEGTLSKSGNTIRFDAEGSESANDFMDAIMAIVDAAE